MSQAAHTPGTPPLRSIVLAGGASSRMGTDKALLRFLGEPQVHRMAGLLERVAPPAYVSVRSAQAVSEAFRGLRLLEDREAEMGPVEGVLSAFREAPECAWLVVAVDMPLLGEGTLRRLIELRDPELYATAYRICEIDAPEPLCTIYEPRIIPVLEGRKAEGRRSLMVLRDLPIRLLEPHDAAELRNVNDPQAHREAEALLRPPRAP